MEIIEFIQSSDITLPEKLLAIVYIIFILVFIFSVLLNFHIDLHVYRLGTSIFSSTLCLLFARFL
mgnify:CR=1 FL=1